MYLSLYYVCFFVLYGLHRVLHVLTHSFPALRSADLQLLSDVGLMIYTSCSTGKPKGAMITYGNMRAVAPGIIDRLGLDGSDAHLSYLPLCHVAEQMLTTFVPIYSGALVNFGESIRTVQEDLREVAPRSEARR